MIPKSRTYEAPERGQIKSSDFNSFQDLLVGDVHSLATELASNQDSLAKALQILIAETRANREEVERAKADKAIQDKILATLNKEIVYVNAWRRTKGLLYASGAFTIPEAQRIRVNTGYGQAVVPFNDTADRLTYRSFNTDVIVMNPDVSVEVAAVSEANAEKVVEGNVNNAFNGVNESYWMREVCYDRKRDIEAVQCKVTLTVPATQITTSSSLVIHPYPTGLVDIMDVMYSTSGVVPDTHLGDAVSIYPEGTTFPVLNAPYTRIMFAPLAATSLSVTLRQRNFMERNGYKSFQYGLQELGLRLVNFDTGFISNDPAPAAGHQVIAKIDCPDGHQFKFINGFWSTPAYKSGAAGWPLWYRVYTDSALSNLVWQSFADPLPQDSYIDVSSTNTDALYVLVSAAYDATASVTPILESFALRYTTKPEA